MVLAPGDRLAGRYRILEAIGAGGMASVFLVEDEPTAARCVLKQLRADDPSLLDAFRSEFSVLGRVSHPHLTRVLDFGSERVRGEPVVYYTCEWVDGVTLAEHGAVASADAAVKAWLDAVDALSALHAIGLRHGDFTPRNVLVRRDGSGVLIDLGCATPFGRAPVISGTTGFLAPEVLAGGSADARADLFAAGATLREVLRTVAERPSTKVLRLIERLVAGEAAERPSDALEVLELFDRDAVARPAPELSRALVGRRDELAAFERWFTAVATRTRGPRVLVVNGARGVGTTRLTRELLWRAELRGRVLRAGGTEHAPVSRLLSLVGGGSTTRASAGAVLAAVRSLSAADEPYLLAVEDFELLSDEQRGLALALARMLEASGSAGLIFSGCDVPSIPAEHRLEVAPLALADVREWTRGLLTERAMRELHEQSGGRPTLITRVLAARPRPGKHAAAGDGAAAAGAPALDLPPPSRELLALIAAVGRPLDLRTWQLDAADLQPLLTASLVQRDAAAVVLARDTAAIDVLSQAELRKAHDRVARAVADSNPGRLPPVQRQAEIVKHLVLAGELERAEQLLLSAAADFRAHAGSVRDALVVLARHARNAEVLALVAELLITAGAPRDALSTAARGYRASTRAEERLRALLAAVDALTRLGRAARARRLLRRALEGERDPEHRARLLERSSRASIQVGAYAEAEKLAREGLELDVGTQANALLHENLGVALGYLGNTEQAELQLHTALGALRDDASPRDRCRILAHRAILAFRAGRIDAAIADHARALGIAEQHELDDLAAVSLLNLGTAEQQAGHLGAALQSYERGLELARVIGRESTELTLLYNLANTYSELGAFERASTTLSRLEQRVSAARLEHFAAPVALLRCELELASGAPERAALELDRVQAVLEQRGQQRELLEVGLQRVDVALAKGEVSAAHSLATSLLPRSELVAADDLCVALELALAKVELAARDPGSARRRLERAHARAQSAGLRILEAALATELVRACQAAGDAVALTEYTARARRAWDRMAADLPQPLLDTYWRHPKRKSLGELTRVFAPAGAAAPRDSEALRRLLSLNRRLNSSLSVERVLDYALQAAIELTGAERGFLVLGEEERVLRGGDATPSDNPSRTIVVRAIEREEPVLTTDAEVDARFSEQRSVHALRLKSVLCVPIVAPSGTLGALYVDSRVQRGRFTEHERDLLLAFADQVAIALSNARLHGELERRSAELEEQKRAVERLSRGQAREIERLQREVEVTRRSLELRYDYSQIVGRSAAMRAVLERLDRVIDSNVNVLIEGESGTGKELAARALHFNGPRKAGPFMGINCGAIPETLLESELFGHVRGAFTGADRDKAGLLVAANGGTLFLDELGEMPTATQAKLLRVLQEREVRPLGATRSVGLDVRLVCATHRDLHADVEAGRFREDLFYRVAVLSLRMPPLRERLEDLPELCLALLNKIARDSGRPVARLGPDALRMLGSHTWPGNVRELENALTRASVLCSNGHITASDLDIGKSTTRPRSSATRREFRNDERERIFQALRSSRWNVSAVSRQLGIPRNTLYRKLARYGLERDPGH